MATRSSKMMRNQVMSIFYSPDLLINPGKFEELALEAKDKNYGIIMGFIRHMKLNLISPEVIKAIGWSTQICHKHGLKFTLETDATHWGYYLTERYPETAVFVCKKGEGRAFNGNFEVTFSLPNIAMGGAQTTLCGLAAVYVLDSKGLPRFIEPSALKKWKEEYFMPMYGLKTYENIHVHDFYRAGGGDNCVTVKGVLKNNYSGKVVVYAEFRDTSHVYVGHPRYLKYQKQLLDMYKNIPLDGVGWDEAVRGADAYSYKMGEGFFQLFRKTKGYRLDKNLIYLDACEYSPEAVKVRTDYYDVLFNVNFRAQDEFNRHAKKLFGADIILGIHQTWCGVLWDLRAGCLPYFKLGRVLSDSYTDSSWMLPRDVVYNLYLSDSIRKELKKDKAYLNDWGGIATNELTNYYTRLKMLFKMNWVSMYMGIASEGLPNFPKTDIWNVTGQCAGLIDRFHEFIGQDYLPSADIAVWLGWESMAYLNNFYIRLYQAALPNMAQTCLERGCHFDFISTDALTNGKIKDGLLRSGNRSYRLLILPYACALPGNTWRQIKAMMARGVPVIFFGLPLQWTTDRQKTVADEFGAQMGIVPITLKAYTDYYTEKKRVPSFSEWEPDTVDFVYPVVPKTAEPLRDMNGDVFAVRKNNAVYLPGVDPREQLVNAVELFIQPDALQYSDCSFYRFYNGDSKGERLLAVVSKMNRILNTIIKINGRELFLKGGRWALLKFKGETITESMLDKGVTVSWKDQIFGLP